MCMHTHTYRHTRKYTDTHAHVHMLTDRLCAMLLRLSLVSLAPYVWPLGMNCHTQFCFDWRLVLSPWLSQLGFILCFLLFSLWSSRTICACHHAWLSAVGYEVHWDQVQGLIPARPVFCCWVVYPLSLYPDFHLVPTPPSPNPSLTLRRMESRTLCLWGKYSTSDLYSQSVIL